jgi:hypothetical protein
MTAKRMKAEGQMTAKPNDGEAEPMPLGIDD